MSVLDRKLRRDLTGVRATLASILIVIVVGVACLVTLASSYNNLESSRRDYYAQCRMADFSVELKKAPLAAVQRVAEIPGVAEIRPRIVLNATIDLDDVVKPLSGQILSIPDEPAPVINNIVLKRGSYFTRDRLEEVIVNDAFAKARNIYPGRTIHVILNNRRQELLVVGTAISSEFVYLMSPGSIAPDSENYGVLYVKRSFAEEALDFDGACNQIVGLFTPAVRDQPDRLLNEIERMLDEFGVFSTTPLSRQPSHIALRDEINGLRVSAVMMPVIFLGVAALVLNILMSRLAEQQRVTVGTLKAMGYGNRVLTLHYLKFGAIIGVIGGVLGIALGLAFAEGHIRLYRIFYEFPHLENRPIPLVFIIGVLVSILFSTLGTLRGVRAIVKLSPAEAMRAKPPAEGGAIVLEKYRRFWRSLGFRWQMIARTVWRNKWRTSVGMLAAALGSSIILLAFYSSSSMEFLLDHQFQKVLLSDVDLVFKDDLDTDALTETKRLPGVDLAEPLLLVPCEFVSGQHRKHGAVTGIIPSATLTIPCSADGTRIEIPETGLVMARRMAEALNVGPGDSITIEPVKGAREPVTAPISRIADSYLGMSTYADYAYLNHLINEEEAISSIQLSLHPGFENRLALYSELKSIPSIQAVSDNEHTEASLDKLLASMDAAISALVMFAAAIFFGSILTNSLVSIAERRREIATLLVMGYEKRQVGGLFLRESMIVNMIGTILGLPLGFWLIIWMTEEYETEFYRFPLVLDPKSFIITIALALGFVFAAHLFVQRSINRLDWQEALNAKE